VQIKPITPGNKLSQQPVQTVTLFVLWLFAAGTDFLSGHQWQNTALVTLFFAPDFWVKTYCGFKVEDNVSPDGNHKKVATKAAAKYLL